VSDTKASTHFEPLSAMDRQFLEMEDADLHMHASGFSVYDQAPLQGEDGGVDFELFRKAIASTLHRIPRYRQRLAFTPIEERPVWVDDANFDLDEHLRHLSLPRPGSKSQLKQLIGWVVSQPLDRHRPLWEMWVVEGIDGGEKFAVVTKLHHCMIDGGAGVNLMQLLLRAQPEYELATEVPFEPKPEPSRDELMRYELGLRFSTPFRFLRGLGGFVGDGSNSIAKLREGIGALGELLENALPASRTPISRQPLGPRRRIDWLNTSVDEMTTLRRRLGTSLNDLVLAIVAGALRRYLGRRGVELETLDFRVSIPVNVRRESESEEMGNRVSSWIVRMPLDEPDPLKQLASIVERTRELKKSNQAVAVELMMAAAEELPVLLSLSATAMQGQISTIVTNIPGPTIPLYLLGCETLNMQPLVPLVPGVGLGVALLSYNGTLTWGFQAEYDLMPDLELFVADIEDACLALESASGETN
jgi:diacylglycerol O-acyltransferase